MAQDLAQQCNLDSQDESDIEDNGSVERLRSSEETRRYDRSTLTAEEEVERLLATEKSSNTRLGRLYGIRDTATRADAVEKKGGRKRRRKGRWGRDGAEEELIFKAEEGERSSSAESSASSSEVDRQRLHQVHRKQKLKSPTCGRMAAIHIVITVAFLALLFGAYKATRSDHGLDKPQQDEVDRQNVVLPQAMSNGTHWFAPTTIVISLDGFRADFVHRGLTPALSSFIRQGVSPKYMLPSFPSVTFPNHFTLVTGMYPEAHGIVGNTFWDPNTKKEFYYTDPDRSMHPEYWNAQPIWETAELQGIKTAIHMWPGSEAHIGALEPTYVDKFNGDEPLYKKVRRILGLLDLPGPRDIGASHTNPRPQLIAAYVPNVDADGHAFGPNSTYIRSTIAEVDGMLGSLFKGINERNLSNIVNIIVVSDHGMATTDNERLIQLEDLIDVSLIEHIDGWPLYGLRPFDHAEEHLNSIYQGLLAKSKEPKYQGHFEVYLRDKNMPERFHFSNNARIAPLWIVPKTGWAIVTKEEFNIKEAVARGEVYSPRGLHGYDHEHPLMRAIFVARGPSFPHSEGSEVTPFQNTELYNILCDTLGLQPRPNNGTMRLPLKTIGFHDLGVMEDIPEDPPPIDPNGQILPPELPGLENLPPAPTKGAADQVEESFNPTVDAPDPEHTRPVVQDGGDDEGKDQSWLDWINEKLKGAKVWAAGVFGGADKDEKAQV